MTERPRVFISYRHVSPDQDLALALHRHLNRNQIEAFLDRDIPWGALWDEQIATHLDAASVFVILVSAHSVHSKMVREEIRRADAGGKRILPIWIGDLQDPGYAIGAWLHPLQYVRWRSTADDTAICDRLVAAIERRDDLPDRSPSAPAPASFPEGALVMERGALSIDDRFYIRRRADLRLEDEFHTGRGRTVVVRGPRQSGKSSLFVRARELVRKMETAVVHIDFQGLEQPLFESHDSLLRALAYRVRDEFRSSIPVQDFLNPARGLVRGFTKYVEEAALSRQPRHLLFLFDEVDRVFNRAYQRDFFGMLRSWHNDRAMNAAWANVSIVLGHSTDPTKWIRDPDQSPFNVAEKIRMDDLNEGETAELISRFGEDPAQIIGPLRELAGGHPYMLRLALVTVKRERMPLNQLASFALDPGSPFADHLEPLWHGVQKAELTQAVALLLRGARCSEDAFQSLFSMGLVAGSGPEDAHFRCRIYKAGLAQRL